MLAEITQEELSAALDRVADDALAEAGIDGPPVDALTVAQRLGIAVAWDADQSGRGRCARLRGHPGRALRPAILLRPDPRAEREHWAIAHEIGEHRAHRVFAALSVDPAEAPTGARETIANRLAGRLLVPRGWVLRDVAECGWDLAELKLRYASASHELIARRMLEFPPPVIVTIFDHGRITLRQSNVPGRTPPLSEAEHQCWRQAHDSGQPSRESGEMIEVRGWPIHEPDWQREILRTELTE
ncbi:MAG TPA: ImmA/IrrE family metallo-endopeptidase [Thermoguttaceae bacterium]|nr:ImmA/IrrE family metallo-endopeptidase [Thermoguttaceae bacterium]